MNYKTLLILILGSILTACNNSTVNIEDEVRQFIANGVEATEAGDVAALKSMLSSDYEDQRGYKRIHIAKLLQMYLSQHKNLHVFYRIRKIEQILPNQVHVTLIAAIANQQMDEADILASLNADITRFELDIVKDGDWAVIQSAWFPALAAEIE